MHLLDCSVLSCISKVFLLSPRGFFNKSPRTFSYEPFGFGPVSAKLVDGDVRRHTHFLTRGKTNEYEKRKPEKHGSRIKLESNGLPSPHALLHGMQFVQVELPCRGNRPTVLNARRRILQRQAGWNNDVILSKAITVAND